MNKNILKSLIISAIIILIVFVICIVFINKNSKKEEYEHLKDYNVNEYIPTYVSTEDLLKIYLNEYLYNMRYNIEDAYESLDKEYRDKKFGSIDNYRSYISQFLTKNITAKKYLKKYINGTLVYKVYDEYDNVYIFKTKGIMQYSLFLDEDTIEIR